MLKPSRFFELDKYDDSNSNYLQLLPAQLNLRNLTNHGSLPAINTSKTHQLAMHTCRACLCALASLPMLTRWSVYGMR